MLVAIDHIDQSLLQRAVPRPLPLLLPFIFMFRYLGQLPWYAYLDPFLLSCVVAAIAMALLRVPMPLWVVLGGLAALHIGTTAWHIGTEIYESLALLRYGKVVRARILRLRPFRDPHVEIDGVFLDCAIPTAKRRLLLASVWLADRVAAERLKAQGFVQVICLERAPGTWLLLEEVNAQLHHYPMA